ncbi:MAG: PQQ-dependent sugar dehydrogenase [Bryobacteraceae bacterium]|nr:PQQ-dependent sugar dehydrogenase [Bryobacteraceae bacterium]
MRRQINQLTTCLGLALMTLVSCNGLLFAEEEKPLIKQPGAAPKELPKIPTPNAQAAEVPAGYRVEVVLTDLEYPSSIEFDDQDAMYVAEAGNIDGAWVARARVLKYTFSSSGERRAELVADNLSGPVTDLLWHQGRMYISHRGKISVLEKGSVRDLVTDLPSFGDHHNNQMTVGPDGKIYFGQGSATNSGVVGVDNFLLGWLSPYPDFRDTPGKDITLRGQAFESADPLTALAENKSRTVKTSAYQSFGKTVAEGTVVKSGARATASILRMDADGKNLEVYAWGLRNPFGVMWGPDNKLYASDNGADERGVRPIANAPDNLWLIKEGAWYGWPDFVSGIAVTDARFKPKDGPAPEFLMKDHPAVEKPLMTFQPHASVTKMDFSRSAKFGFEGQMFLAASGDYSPATALKQERAGYWIQRIDTVTGKGEVFFRTKRDALGPKDLEYVSTAGPKRPVDVRFSPSGEALYVVDIGAVAFIRTATGPTPRPFPTTGVVWRITREK